MGVLWLSGAWGQDPETERCKPVLDLCCSFQLLLAACQGPLKFSASSFVLFSYRNIETTKPKGLSSL